MKVRKVVVVDQNSTEMEDLADKYQTTRGICGYVTCAVAKFISENGFDPQNIAKINSHTLTPYIEETMKFILSRRRQEIKKFKIIADHQRKAYLKDYVANYEIADFLEFYIDAMPNKQVFFFRQSAYDHPQLVKDLTFQQAWRTQQEEQPFKGDVFFYTSFGPYEHHFKEEFQTWLRGCNKEDPIMIATDVFGHYNTTVLFKGHVYILDSLDPTMDSKYDSSIVECISYLYKQSYLIKDQPLAKEGMSNTSQ